MVLYDWQREALSAWRARGHRGIVEAVTGTGKTMVGLGAAAETLASGGKVQVLVPTVELLNQWVRATRRHLPKVRVGELGDGADGGLITSDVLISVVNSARRPSGRPLPPCSLLVADECHRYGSGVNALALNEQFERRLGISATYARSDDGNATYLDPYFGKMCFRMGYARAIKDGVTARFKVAMVGVRFAPGEDWAYSDAHRKASDARRALVLGGVIDHPFGEFIKRVSDLAKGRHGWLTVKARAFLLHFAEKRRILAETAAKRQKLIDLMPSFAKADGSILFTQTIDAAEHAANLVHSHGIAAESLHSELEREERRATLKRFSNRQTRVVAAPQVLDEGIDVPAADLAVILAASSQRRQMIQRMGRILRTKADGRLARFVILYVYGTSEDPAVGAHEDFLEEVTSVADEVRTFRDARPEELCEFLNDMRPGVRTPLAPSFQETGSALRSDVPKSGSGALVPRLVTPPQRGKRAKAHINTNGQLLKPGESHRVSVAPVTPTARLASSPPAKATGRVPQGARKARTREQLHHPNAGPASDQSGKLPKRLRDADEAQRKGMTVDQLLSIRRAEYEHNLRLHQIAKSRGISVKQLRRESATS